MTDLTPTEMAGYSRSGAAITNTDKNSLESYKRKKQQNRRIHELERRVSVLEECIRVLMDNRNGQS